MKSAGDIHRREFFRRTGTGLALSAIPPQAPAQDTNTGSPVRFGLVGCGGRGTHDATTMIEAGGGQLVALGDLIEAKLSPAKQRLDAVLQNKGFPPVSASRLYGGANSSLRLAQSDLDAVLIAITPYYYPQVLEAVSTTGKHIYCEKPLGTDVAGVMKVIDLARAWDGKIVFHVGLQVPWATAMQEMQRRIDAGAIGKIVSAHSFFYWSGGGGRQLPPNVNLLEARIRNWGADRVLSGDYIVEQNVHGLDKMNWILKGHPISAVAKGGRTVRTGYGDNFDHYSAELVYPDNVIVSFQSTQFLKGWIDAGERFFGTRGSSESHYTGGVRIHGEEPWDSGFKEIVPDAETQKCRGFINDIKTRNFRNEAFRGAESTLTAILVRTAAYQGREVTWDQVVSSNEQWDPHIDLKQFG